MKKQDILNHGEKLAKRQGKFYGDPGMEAGVSCGFTTAVELLWPAIEALDDICEVQKPNDLDWRDMCGGIKFTALKALIDLEKALEGGE